ncbi:aminotransferase class V-fold PLP-dependent enzyme [Alkalicella caledoniensis]|uniref:Aminotransferase class V-fold PLP-dependent enzyme n=1 Tax=Alkalicella caledoniensis TaxID=2731377 RepID=A0A7G9W416_ALKCA|nr:aminotransferase class V-fold PLP-dependent enzyme [Alkalicella caledoniensis]QNO13428.1 aminotransferase class V-fold PLP-dependent enzyme [Alkalicella caledoniensis]
METYPIKTIDIEQAKQLQFKLVDIIHQHFRGDEFLQAGDYGVVPGLGKPHQTTKVEKVLAQFFDSEAAILLRGAGTGAIRNVFNTTVKPNDKIIVHKAPIYPTTKVIIESMGLHVQYLDFNDLDNINEEKINTTNFALIQYSRQQMKDSYDIQLVIKKLKEVNKNITILTDDNYVVMKTQKIGAQLGADASAFSLFKLLGPEGVGCVVGKQEIIDKIKRHNYSGGSQVQGFEAMEALRALVYAPVSLAIQGEEGNKIIQRLNQGEAQGVKKAFIANAQSRVILVELENPVAKQVLQHCNELGGAPHPVGAESKYEITSMFYRVSGTFLESDPSLEHYMIRINPMRSGADTVIRILKAAIELSNKKGE